MSVLFIFRWLMCVLFRDVGPVSSRILIIGIVRVTSIVSWVLHTTHFPVFPVKLSNMKDITDPAVFKSSKKNFLAFVTRQEMCETA